MAEKMKDSGIAWIGEIPDSWEPVRVRHVIKSDADGIRVGPFGSSLKEAILEDGISDYKVYGQANLIRHNFEYGDNYVAEKDFRRLKNYEIKVGDVLLSMMGTIGKCSVVPNGIQTGVMDSHLIKIRLNDFVNPVFFEYVYEHSGAVYEQLVLGSNGSTMNGLNSTIVKNVYIPLPPLPEQHAIATHLDRKCGQIDYIIADLQRQIECLQSYKKSLISETVTKGLNPNVPMKDSGIEWIGQIPEHWDVSRLKYCCEVKTGPFGTQLSAEEYVDDGVPIINVKNIGYGSIKDEDLDQIPDVVKERLSAHVLQRGDIVFGRKGAVDKHAIINSQHDGWVQGSDCMRVRIKSEIKPEFLNYYFGAAGYGEYVLVNSVGATMASVNAEILNNSVIVFPSLEEQQAISAYLDRKCAQIDTILDDKRRQVENMKNHRKSVIYEYVTGKKRVKEV